jgi:tRNA-modifying protein YgfZ
MQTSLSELQQQAGAIFEPFSEVLIATDFGNRTQALAAVQHGVAFCDRSHWGRLQVSDQDRLKFLHNQSTNDFNALMPGQGCDTVFITSTARTLDLATAYVTEEEVWLLVSPSRRQQLMQWLDRYIFFGDRVQLSDLSASTSAFSLLGPQSATLLQKLGVHFPDQVSLHNHAVFEMAGVEVRVAIGSGLVTPGFTLITSEADAPAVWSHLVEKGAVPMGEQVWEELRIQQGRPKPDCELTEDYNPLEAGLWQTISFNKGCYIGQETIARLNTYQGVKQQLWGVKLAAPVDPGSTIKLAESKVGILTSCTQTDAGYLGLAYVKTKVMAAGLHVLVGDVTGELIELPFLSHQQQSFESK